MPKRLLDKTLNPDVLATVQSFLTPEERNVLDAASKVARDTASLFQEVPTVRTERIVSKLLEHVVKGHQAKAEELIKKYPEYLLVRGNVTDLTGRQFIEISAFEYAIWAMDSHMYKMMERCIAEGAAGVELRPELLAQCNRVTKDGIDYTLNGATVHECHFNYKELFAVYETYQRNYNSWTTVQCATYLCTQIGGAQSRLPMHVVNEFCRPDKTFWPLIATHFKEAELPRVAKLYNSISRAEMDWFPGQVTKDNRLGFEFCVFRSMGAGAWEDPRAVGWPGTRGHAISRDQAIARVDLLALKALFKERTNDWIKLVYLLLTPLSLRVELQKAFRRNKGFGRELSDYNFREMLDEFKRDNDAGFYQSERDDDAILSSNLANLRGIGYSSVF